MIDTKKNQFRLIIFFFLISLIIVGCGDSPADTAEEAITSSTTDETSTTTTKPTVTTTSGGAPAGGGTGQVLVSGSINSSSDELSTSLSSYVKNFRSSTSDLQRSRNARYAPRYAHLIDSRPGTGDDSRGSSRTAAKLSECKAIAYWANTDEKIAETTVDNNTYTFTDDQIAPGKTYKVVAECKYEGQTVKLSS